MDVRVRTKDGEEHTLAVPQAALGFIDAPLAILSRSERIAISEADVMPNEAAELLGTSRPPAGHQMDTGGFPFRYAGKHPRTGFAGVVALTVTLDERGSPLQVLAEDPNQLAKPYRVFYADRGLGLLRALSIRPPQPFSSGGRGSADRRALERQDPRGGDPQAASQ